MTFWNTQQIAFDMSVADSTLRDVLCQSPFAAGWPSDVIEEVAAMSQWAEYPVGAVIFEQGSVNHTLFLLNSGLVGLDMRVPIRGSVRILTLGGGEVLAWSALVGDGQMTATATALEPVRAIAIDGARLKTLCQRRTEIGFHVMSRLAVALSHRLTATRLQLLDLYAHTTPHVLKFGASDH